MRFLGTNSLFETAEKALVIICIQMGMTRKPLTLNEGIQLMNSLIKQANLQCNVIKFQQARNIGNNGFKYGEVGKSW